MTARILFITPARPLSIGRSVRMTGPTLRLVSPVRLRATASRRERARRLLVVRAARQRRPGALDRLLDDLRDDIQQTVRLYTYEPGEVSDLRSIAVEAVIRALDGFRSRRAGSDPAALLLLAARRRLQDRARRLATRRLHETAWPGDAWEVEDGSPSPEARLIQAEDDAVEADRLRRLPAALARLTDRERAAVQEVMSRRPQHLSAEVKALAAEALERLRALLTEEEGGEVPLPTARG